MATVCRGCGAALRWIKSVNGKPIPCDPERVVEYISDLPTTGPRISLVTPEGQVISGPRVTVLAPGARSVEGYVSHFGTCPQAAQFRRTP